MYPPAFENVQDFIDAQTILLNLPSLPPNPPPPDDGGYLTLAKCRIPNRRNNLISIETGFFVR